MLLHFGPQHPSTHGVFRMDLYLDGEIIVKAVPHCGYLHRAVEKLCEKLAYVQITPIVDKNDYVAPMTNEQALVMVFETMLKLEVPRRARWMRTIFAELQRIASHLLWLGTFCARPRRRAGRRLDRLHLLLPRARADPRPLRGRDRRALSLQHAHHRRKPARHPRGLEPEGAGGAGHHRRAAARVRGDDRRRTASSSERTRGRGRARRRAGARAGHHRPQPARLAASTTTCAATRRSTRTTR